MDVFDLKANRIVKSIRYQTHRVLKYQVKSTLICNYKIELVQPETLFMKPAYTIPTVLDGGKRTGIVMKVIKAARPLHFMDFSDVKKGKYDFKPLNNKVLRK